MSKVWYCPNCGYEVESRGRCHLCRQKLVASPLPALPAGDEDDEVGYRIEGWTDRARGRLIAALIEEGIAHRFEEDDLVVSVGDEERTDAVVEELSEAAGYEESPAAFVGEGAAGEASGDGFAPDEEVRDSVVLLYEAARRLRVDPTDMEADGEVAEASAGIFLTESFGPAGPDTWAAVGRVTRRLLAALGAEEALEDEIRRQASVLVVLLEPVVGAGGAEEPGEVAGALALAEPAGAGTAVAGVEAEEVGAEPVAAVAGGEAEEVGAEAEEAATEPAAEDAAGLGEEETGAEEEEAARPRLLGGGPETSYEMPEWLPEQRAFLTVLLDERSIRHVWDGPDLVVPSDEEAVVESLFDLVGGAPEEEDDEERYHHLEELFAAVARLAGEPDDEHRGAEVIAASSALEGPTPLGFDDGQWLAMRRRARTLADAIEHHAHADVVASQAQTLRDMLRQLV